MTECKELYSEWAALNPEFANQTNEQLMLALSDELRVQGRKRDVLLACLMVRYWPVLRQYASKSTTVADWHEVHGWLVDSIIYVAEQRAWEKEGSTLRERKRWADSAVNTRMKCTRINAYQASNRDKRCLDYTSASFESLSEEYGDAFQQNFAEDPLFLHEDGAYNLVRTYLGRQEYFTALVVDAVVNHNVLEYNEDGTSSLSTKKLRKHLSTLPQNFASYLQEEYGVPSRTAENAVTALQGLEGSRLDTNIKKTLQQLYYQLWMTVKKGKQIR